jgi:hypothetical protein
MTTQKNTMTGGEIQSSPHTTKDRETFANDPRIVFLLDDSGGILAQRKRGEVILTKRKWHDPVSNLWSREDYHGQAEESFPCMD